MEAGVEAAGNGIEEYKVGRMNGTYEYWEELYDQEGKKVPQNDKERLAAELLRKGASYSDAKIKSGLSGEEMENLYERLLKWEGENFKK